jgi:peptidyl-prolyl cis-trans isomerase A (cyclophilin A)
MRTLVAVFILAITSTAQTGMVGQSAPAKPAAPAGPNPVAVIDTTVGKMTCTLFPDKAPMGVANFIGLATGTKDWKNPISGATKRHTPLYDGTIFHRVIPGFMIQGGDPAGNGSGDPGYQFKNETSPDLPFDRPGRLAYANSGPNTNGSQFFITEVPTPHLNGGYTIFGQCDDPTVALVKQIAGMARDPSNDKPLRPVKITHVTIYKNGLPAAKPAASTSSGAKKRATTPKSANPVDK